MRVAISGAGIAGPALAFWLSRCGHEVCLIEQSQQLRNGGYVIDFWGVGYTVAERMGLIPQIREAGYFLEDVKMVNNNGQRTGGFSADAIRRMTDGRYVSLPRGDLAAILYQSLDANVETLFGESIQRLEQRSDDVLVEMDHGSPRTFDFVVGADGLHSKVRELVFGPEANFEKFLDYYVAAFAVSGYRPRDELAYVSYSLPGRQISRFALREDRTMFLCVFAAEHLPGSEAQAVADPQAALREIYQDGGWECAAILEAMQTAPSIYFDRVSQIHIPEWSRDKVVLIGDAAACVSLLAGEGSGLALTEAYVLAGELERASGNLQMAFSNYENRLRPLIQQKQKSARQFARSFAPRTRWGIWLRDQLSRLLGVPLAGKVLIGRNLDDKIDLPNYHWPEPSVARPHL